MGKRMKRRMQSALKRLEVLEQMTVLYNEDVLRRSSPAHNVSGLERLVGVSPAIRRIKKLIRQIRDTDSPILIVGPTGVGKELVAECIHRASHRRGRPFIALSVANLPATLFESELFGAVRGAYSGAERDRPGLAMAAEGGTLFIDDIEDLSPENQAKILRFIETHEVRPLGSTTRKIVDVRIITASNRNLKRLIEKGWFRRDLYYRIKGVSFYIPPLRKRPEDIPLLVLYFFNLYQKRYGKKLRGFHPQTWRKLMAYPWPGNVRELRNEMERLVILSRDGASVKPSALSPEIRRSRKRALPPSGIRLKDYMAITEREYLKAILEYTGGNVSRSARLLGISRVSLNQKIRRYRLQSSLNRFRQEANNDET